tara:strand:+ start:8488 stop:9303 length:816 start_codon:yes stop_codon:yes gene_type:complete
MFSEAKVQFSSKDTIRKIKIPLNITPKLANLIGIHLGDGNIYVSPNNYDYAVTYTGHLVDEYEWYTKDISLLIESLFNIFPSIQEDKRKNKSSIRLWVRSKAIVHFLSEIIGLPRGNKYTCNVPSCILSASNEIKCAFLSGFFDTDFSLTFSKRKAKGIHKYPTLSLHTSNTNLAKDIVKLLKGFGFEPYTRYNFEKKVLDKTHLSNAIEINGKENLEKFMKLIGFSSPKHITKYEVWKRFGFCPPYTTLAERRNMLAGKLDPLEYYSKNL